MKRINIRIDQLTRTEGHGKLVIQTTDGGPPHVRWAITESPRFFEVMLRGRPWLDAHVLASRVCGICSVSHLFSAIRATERAFRFEPSEQTILLRKLLYAGEMMESHMLHVYLLAGPDFFGTGSIFPLLETKDRESVLVGLRLKKLGNDIMELIGGRTVHPQSPAVGQFNRLPHPETLRHLSKRLDEAIPDLEATVKLFKGFRVPEFDRETEYIALKYDGEYALVRGDIFSTDTGPAPLDHYLDITNEYVMPDSTALYTKHARGSYMVGALSRININHEYLTPRAKEMAAELGLSVPCHNPFMITWAQIVETAHEVEEAKQIVDHLLEQGLREEKPPVHVQAGRGVGAVEAPRGLLIHDYTYDDTGHVTKANLIIPTNQNNGSIQEDLEALVRDNLDKSEDELRLLCEMLVRAYDPCIGCSTH